MNPRDILIIEYYLHNMHKDTFYFSERSINTIFDNIWNLIITLYDILYFSFITVVGNCFFNTLLNIIYNMYITCTYFYEIYKKKIK